MKKREILLINRNIFPKQFTTDAKNIFSFFEDPNDSGLFCITVEETFVFIFDLVNWYYIFYSKHLSKIENWKLLFQNEIK